MMVCGQGPFNHANDSETLTMIMDCKYELPDTLSEDCKRYCAIIDTLFFAMSASNIFGLASVLKIYASFPDIRIRILNFSSSTCLFLNLIITYQNYLY